MPLLHNRGASGVRNASTAQAGLCARAELALLFCRVEQHTRAPTWTFKAYGGTDDVQPRKRLDVHTPKYVFNAS